CGLDQQLIGLAVAPAEGTPAHLDRLEAARHCRFQFLAQRGRLVKEDRTVRLDARTVVAAEQARDGLVALLAKDVPQRDVDAADGVLHRAAAALPERRLPQLLGDARRLVGPLADQDWPQKLDGAVRQRLAGEDTTDARQALVGEHL